VFRIFIQKIFLFIYTLYIIILVCKYYSLDILYFKKMKYSFQLVN